MNASPRASLRPAARRAGTGKRTGDDWFDEVAPAEHAALYATVRDVGRPRAARSTSPTLTAEQRRALAHSFERGSAWPGDGDARYAALVEQVAAESARRWRAAIGTTARGDAVAAAAHRQRALLRARRVAEGLHAVPHRDAVGLAPALRAPRSSTVEAARRRSADGRVGGGRAAARRRHGDRRCAGTSRCAGVTVGSAARRRRRCTSTRRTPRFPATSRSTERRRLDARPTRRRARAATRRRARGTRRRARDRRLRSSAAARRTRTTRASRPPIGCARASARARARISCSA